MQGEIVEAVCCLVGGLVLFLGAGEEDAGILGGREGVEA